MTNAPSEVIGKAKVASVFSFGASVVGYSLSWVSYAADYTVLASIHHAFSHCKKYRNAHTYIHRVFLFYSNSHLPEKLSAWKIFFAAC